MLEQEGGRNRFGENGNEIGSRNVKRAGISRRETRIAKNYDGNKDRDTLV